MISSTRETKVQFFGGNIATAASVSPPGSKIGNAIGVLKLRRLSTPLQPGAPVPKDEQSVGDTVTLEFHNPDSLGVVLSQLLAIYGKMDEARKATAKQAVVEATERAAPAEDMQFTNGKKGWKKTKREPVDPRRLKARRAKRKAARARAAH